MGWQVQFAPPREVTVPECMVAQPQLCDISCHDEFFMADGLARYGRSGGTGAHHALPPHATHDSSGQRGRARFRTVAVAWCIRGDLGC